MVETTEGMALLPGRVRHLPSGREAPLAVIARMLPEGDRTCTDQFIMDVSKDTTGTGQAFPIGFPHVFFSYGAHAVRVEVDELTGKAEVLDYLAVTDGGRVINPRNFEQQVQGAVAQGLGYALMEELLLQDGWIDNPDFAGYMLPTFLDVPDIVSLAVQTVEETGPFGMKGIGEVGVNAPLPAVATAIRDALGIRFRVPLTPERILGSPAGKGPKERTIIRDRFVLNGKAVSGRAGGKKVVDLLRSTWGRQDQGGMWSRECGAARS
jgi:CO/xanthine dehydrogenase Mo-binding subunit